MGNLDNAFFKMKTLSEEIKGYEDTIFSEQDHRVKIIDRIALEILGWGYSDFNTEDKAGDGFIDYKFSINGLSRLVIEAKRDGIDFGLKDKISGRAFKLNGPALSSTVIKQGINQAIRYCGHKNCELACVTNGKQWIIFRGSRLGDGKDTLDGVGFLFSDLECILESFSLFYSLLSYESILQYNYRPYFTEEEGQPIRQSVFKKSFRDPNSKQLLSTGKWFHDIDKIMNIFFRKISGDEDPEMINKCFVTTKESSLADIRLTRISEDLVNKVRGIDTSEAKILTELIENVKDQKRNEFVVLIGNKGAGKSTFVDRFFAFILPKELAKDCIVIKVNLADSNGDYLNVPKWLDDNLLIEAEKAIFKDKEITYEELQGMFFDEYSRWMKGPHKYLYESNKEQFKINFGKHIDERRENRPHEYIQRLISSVVSMRKKVPCIVFDNADHFSIEFQEAVFQYARSIYENTLCLVITPVTDKTSWQLSRQGVMRSFDSELLYLPTPPPEHILEKRILFIEEKLQEDKRVSGHGYFLRKGIRLTLDNLTAFIATLQSIFLHTGNVALYIGNLANRDIRSCLEIVRGLISSPYITIDELLKTYHATTTVEVNEKDIKKALIRERYDIYPFGQHRYVQNIYCLNTEIETSPFLGLRILQLLIDASHRDPDGKATFISVDQVIEYFRNLGFEQRCLVLIIQAMLNTGLCLSYDPTKITVAEIKSIEISPSGQQHYYWGLQDFTYIYSMSFVTPLHERSVFEEMRSIGKTSRTGDYACRLIKIFIQYLIDEDMKYTTQQEHESYKGQNEMINIIKKFAQKASAHIEE